MLDLVEFRKMCEQNGIEQEKGAALYEMLKGKIKPRKYGIVWEEQEEDIEKTLKDRYTVLHEVTEREIKLDEGGRTHSLIEGDNLEALTFLKNSGKKVDVIYIDPPYNTLNSGFIYNDNYVDKEDTWRHSKWLSFMNKRLVLARELLTDEGVIFISIDEYEFAQLKMLCDSIFGEHNHLFTTVRKTKSMTGDDGSGLNIQHDFLIAYGKRKEEVKLEGDEKEFKEYKNPDNDPNGPWVTADPTARSGSDSTYFPIENPYTGKVDYPSNGRYWAFSKETMLRYIDSGRITFKEKHPKNQRGFIFKRYKNHMTNTKKTVDSLKFTDNIFLNSNGTSEVREILGSNKFSYPKPVSLIKEIIKTYPKSDAVILDFFAGSGTTAHAVLELNKEDGGNRQVILCTNNENNIAEEVTYERIKRVMEGYTTPKGKQIEGIPGNLRYFKVDSVDADEDIYTLEDNLLEVVVPFIQYKEDAWNITTGKPGFTYLDDRVTIYNDPYHLDEDFLDHIKGDVFYIYDGWMDYLDIEELKDIRVVPIPKEFFKLFR